MREPGLYAVVCARHRDSQWSPLWFRAAIGGGTCWMGTDGTWASWTDLIAPVVIRDGVAA